jgi:predicted thioesterase
MRNIFKPGDKKQLKTTARLCDSVSSSEDGAIQFYTTSCLARDVESIMQQFVLEMQEKGEQGVGTYLGIDFKSQAFIDEEITITAWVDQMNNNELFCFFEAKVGERLIALGKTGQKILKQEMIDLIR